MRPKDLYFTLGMDKGLYSKVKIEDGDVDDERIVGLDYIFGETNGN